MDQVIFRDGQPLAITDNAQRWFLRHQPMSMDWAIEHEGYRVNDADAVALCATCLKLAESGAAVWALVTTSDPENPVSVRRHPDCPHPPHAYRVDPGARVRELVAELPRQ